jgi:hypothetical protein
LVILCETNILNLISQRLDTIYQIKPKCATIFFYTFLHLFTQLNTPVVVQLWAGVVYIYIYIHVHNCKEKPITSCVMGRYTSWFNSEQEHSAAKRRAWSGSLDCLFILFNSLFLNCSLFDFFCSANTKHELINIFSHAFCTIYLISNRFINIGSIVVYTTYWPYLNFIHPLCHCGHTKDHCLSFYLSVALLFYTMMVMLRCFLRVDLLLYQQCPEWCSTRQFFFFDR